jgi:hypothetical protein
MKKTRKQKGGNLETAFGLGVMGALAAYLFTKNESQKTSHNKSSQSSIHSTRKHIRPKRPKSSRTSSRTSSRASSRTSSRASSRASSSTSMQPQVPNSLHKSLSNNTELLSKLSQREVPQREVPQREVPQGNVLQRAKSLP